MKLDASRARRAYDAMAVAAGNGLVQTVPMIRPFIALVLVAGLTACGFHLRSKLALPPDTPAVQVSSATPYSELAKLLRRGVVAVGGELVEEDAGTGGNFAQLKVLSERWGADIPPLYDTHSLDHLFSRRHVAIGDGFGASAAVGNGCKSGFTIECRC